MNAEKRSDSERLARALRELDRSRSVSHIASEAGVSENFAEQGVKPLKEFGVVREDNGLYSMATRSSIFSSRAGFDREKEKGYAEVPPDRELR